MSEPIHEEGGRANDPLRVPEGTPAQSSMSAGSESSTAWSREALEQARAGRPVFPVHSINHGSCTCGRHDCDSAGKHPWTQNGFKDATTDPEQIRTWAKTLPDANLGIVTGTSSGIVVLDVDPRNDGNRTLTAKIAKYGPLPETRAVATGGGGVHYYFRAPTKSTNGRVLGNGLDLKADGGYVVAPPSVHATGSRYTWTNTDDLADVPAWILEDEHHVDIKGISLEKDSIKSGERNTTMTSIAGQLRHCGLSGGAIEAALLVENQRLCAPPLPEREVRSIAQSVARYPAADIAATPLSAGSSRHAVATAAASVRRERVTWLMQDRIPLANVTLLAGQPGLGKSLFTCLLAADVSTGRLPCGQGAVLMASAEDSFSATIRPRLEAARADLEEVHFVEMRHDDVADGLELPDDVAELRRLVAETRAKLVTIDPLMAHLPAHVNSYRDQSVRRALAPLHRLAQKLGCAILVVVHLNKAQGSDPIGRVGGSIGLIGAARSALLLDRDPQDPDGEHGRRRVLAHFKSNCGPESSSQLYAVEPTTIPAVGEHPQVDTARLSLLGESSITARTLLAASTHDSERSELDEAVDFLREELDGRALEVKEIKRRAKQAGISERTLERAKSKLGIKAEKQGFGAGSTWSWTLNRLQDSEERHELGRTSHHPDPGGLRPGKETPENHDPPAPDRHEERQATEMAPYETVQDCVGSCRYGDQPDHRRSQWTAPDGRTLCGICHPPANAHKGEGQSA